MAAKIIAAVNQKGGSGKTTLSMQLAGALARRGHEVLIVDADESVKNQGRHLGEADQSSSRKRPFEVPVLNLRS